MKQKWFFGVVIVLAIALGGVFLLHSAYEQVRHNTLEQWNSQQKVLATQVARSIEGFFGHYQNVLRYLARNSHIQEMDADGREIMRRFHSFHATSIKALTRIDEKGRVIFTVPFSAKAIGADVSSQSHNSYILRVHKPVLSQVYTAVQGYQAVAYAVPVFQGDVYKGCLTVLVPFRHIAASFLDGMQPGPGASAWLVGQAGNLLYTSKGSAITRQLITGPGACQSLASLFGHQTKGESGSGSFECPEWGNAASASGTQRILYLPIKLENTFWSVAISAPEDEILAAMQGFTTRMLIFTMVFLGGGLLLSFYLIKTWIAVAETRKRKRAEAALLQSEERLRLMADNLPNAMVYQVIAETDGSRQFTYVSGNVQRLNEVTAEEVMADPSVLYKQVLPEFQTDLAEKEKRSIDTLETFNAEVCSRMPSGRLRWFDLSSTPHRLSDGRIVFDGVEVDVTERKEFEEALRESEEKYRHHFETAMVGMYRSRLEDGKFLDANLTLARMMGYESVDKFVEEYITSEHYADPTRRKELLQQLRIHGELDGYEIEMTRVDGSIIHVALSAKTKSDQGCLEGVVVDITENKRAEDAIKESEARFRTLVEYSPEAIVVFDNDTGRFIDANKNAEELYGLQAEELLKLGPVDLSPLLQPDGRASGEAAMAYIQEALEGRVPTFDWTHLNVTEDREVPCEIRLVRLPAPASGLNLIRASITDISARKLAEEERAHLESQLRQAQKMQAIGILAGGIAHDFNNILSAIMGYGELAQLDAKEGRDNSARLDHIVDAAERARDLVKQLLTFSRKSEAELKLIDINQLVPQGIKMLEHTIPKMIDIEMKLAGGLEWVRADATQLEQVVMNLAGNASDAMPDGGSLVFETSSVLLDREFAEQHLEITPGRHVMLSVADNGAGMDEQTLGQIFDPFFTTKDIGKGTGLGLSTVYGVVKEHGGHITCDSELGRGTTFKIYLPAVEPESKPFETEEPSQQIAPGGQETILLVDDEDAIREMGAEMLMEVGYRVIRAASGEEALVPYKNAPQKIDLVVLDLGMPGMGGHKCLLELLAINPALKVLIASGYSAEGTVKDTLQEGAAGYIAKPFRRDQLLNMVRNILDT